MTPIPPGPLTRSAADRLTAAADLADRSAAELRDPAPGPPVPVLLPAKLTSYDSGTQRYAWAEQQCLPDGTRADRPGGRTGTATYEPAVWLGGGPTTGFPVQVILRRAAGGGALGPVWEVVADGVAASVPVASRTVTGTVTAPPAVSGVRPGQVLGAGIKAVDALVLSPSDTLPSSGQGGWPRLQPLTWGLPGTPGATPSGPQGARLATVRSLDSDAAAHPVGGLEILGQLLLTPRDRAGGNYVIGVGGVSLRPRDYDSGSVSQSDGYETVCQAYTVGGEDYLMWVRHVLADSPGLLADLFNDDMAPVEDSYLATNSRIAGTGYSVVRLDGGGHVEVVPGVSGTDALGNEFIEGVCTGVGAAPPFDRDLTVDIGTPGQKVVGIYGIPIDVSGGLTNGQALRWVGATNKWTPFTPGTGNGTVTSVGITPGTGISVSGSPVTGSGSITVGIANGGVGTTQLADGAVTPAKLSDNRIPARLLRYPALARQTAALGTSVSVATGSWTTVLSLTAAQSGTYLVLADCRMYLLAGAGGPAYGVWRLAVAGTEVTNSRTQGVLLRTASEFAWEASSIAMPVAITAGQTVTLQATHDAGASCEAQTSGYGTCRLTLVLIENDPLALNIAGAADLAPV